MRVGRVAVHPLGKGSALRPDRNPLFRSVICEIGAICGLSLFRNLPSFQQNGE